MQLYQIRAESERTTYSRFGFPKVVTFVGKAKLARLSVGILCPVPACLWLFSILAQLCGFVKNFFRTSENACCRNCNRFPAFRLSVGILCPVRFALSGLRGYCITYPSQSQALFFRISEIVLRLSSTRATSLFAVLVSCAIALRVRIPSARLPLLLSLSVVMA